MHDYLVTSSQLTNIASAIRSKNGESYLYTVDEMPSKILAITGGGGVVPTGTYSVSSNGVYNIYNYASVDVNVPVDTYILKKDNLLTIYTSNDTTIE